MENELTAMRSFPRSQATGYGGTVQRTQTLEDKLESMEADGSEEGEGTPTRELTVHFNADTTDEMHWKFYPTQRSVRTTPGESTLAFYTVKNLRYTYMHNMPVRSQILLT